VTALTAGGTFGGLLRSRLPWETEFRDDITSLFDPAGGLPRGSERTYCSIEVWIT
jgi:hypothetical protein